MTPVALIQGACVQFTLRGVATMRTYEAIGPAYFEHHLTALLFGTVALEEIRQTQAFLKLNAIGRHGAISLFSLCSIIAAMPRKNG
jgi:hypothetical protein